MKKFTSTQTLNNDQVIEKSQNLLEENPTMDDISMLSKADKCQNVGILLKAIEINKNVVTNNKTNIASLQERLANVMEQFNTILAHLIDNEIANNPNFANLKATMDNLNQQITEANVALNSNKNQANIFKNGLANYLADTEFTDLIYNEEEVGINVANNKVVYQSIENIVGYTPNFSNYNFDDESGREAFAEFVQELPANKWGFNLTEVRNAWWERLMANYNNLSTIEDRQDFLTCEFNNVANEVELYLDKDLDSTLIRTLVENEEIVPVVEKTIKLGKTTRVVEGFNWDITDDVED